MENWLFSQFFTKYFLDFWLRSQSIDLWKITPDFYNNLSDFGGGTFRRSPPPDATDMRIIKTVWIFNEASGVIDTNSVQSKEFKDLPSFISVHFSPLNVSKILSLLNPESRNRGIWMYQLLYLDWLLFRGIPNYRNKFKFEVIGGSNFESKSEENKIL